MGAGDSRVNQNIIRGSVLITIPTSIFQVSKAVCKIITPYVFGTGFLIKFFKGTEDFFCLMSCEHVITKKLIQKKEKISFYFDNESKIREIKLEPNERFIKDFRDIDIDVTIVEIIKSDNITEDYFLLPNINFMSNLSQLTNIMIQIPQFPKGGNLSFSEGPIIKVDKYELVHCASTESCSSGSPLLLKDTIKVLGIHKAGNIRKEENYAYSIGPIFNYIKNGFLYDLKYENIDRHYLINENIDKLYDEKYKLYISASLMNKYHFSNMLNVSFRLCRDRFYFYRGDYILSILKVCSDTGYIKFRYNNNIYENISINSFFYGYGNNPKCSVCMSKPSGRKTKMQYCVICKKYLCKKCLEIAHYGHFKSMIAIEKIDSICLNHNKEIAFYCKDCEKNICKTCENYLHEKHDIEKIIDQSRIDKAKKEICKKNIKLLKLKEFFKIVRIANKLNPNNIIYQNNVTNLANCIKKEKNRNEYDMDLAIKQIKNANNNQ